MVGGGNFIGKENMTDVKRITLMVTDEKTGQE
jgi:hypothetical protein